MFVKSWRCFNSRSKTFDVLFSPSLLAFSMCARLECEPFSVFIKWFNVFAKFDWKFVWFKSFEIGLINDELLYEWLLSWESGVNVGYWIFWCNDPILPRADGDDVVITLEIVLKGIPDIAMGRKLGTIIK